MTDDMKDWTRAEREAFAKLGRTMPFDPVQEERTVRALRAEGLLGVEGARGASGGGATPSALEERRRLRPLRVALAIAAGLGCFLAGRLSERAGVWGAHTEAAVATLPGASHTVLADSQQHAPVIRF